jgi:hypothetical protein
MKERFYFRAYEDFIFFPGYFGGAFFGIDYSGVRTIS